MQQLILELKENNEDFEFYPTSKEMIKPIYDRLNRNIDVLDIGAGTCNFKKYFEEFANEQDRIYCEKEKMFRNSYVDGKGYNYDLQPSRNEQGKHIKKYYVIEKSQTLINKFDKDVIVLGTDFYNTLLIDKKADIYFCNPPYSQFENWTIEILKNGNFKQAYLIIPERWKNNQIINNIIERFNIKYTILGSFNFLNAERQARAKVDVIEFDKQFDRYKDLEDFNKNAFNSWFDETFKMRNSENDNKYEYEIEREKRENIKNELVGCKTKGDFLVNSYNAEQMKLFEQFKAICSLDVETLETIGVKKEAIKEAIKQKIKTLKTRYWKIVFDEFSEITDRLTSETRNDLFERFKELQTVDFTLENIYPLILWVIKNANTYYNDQLISFFKKLSSPDNIKQYKSNKKVFERDKWRHSTFKHPDKISHYTLDYRIIMSSPFETDWHGNFDGLKFGNKEALKDILTIAKNLGFKVGECVLPNCFGQKVTIYYADNTKTFMEYRAYKNGNMHVKFDIEFAKAMNVEVSRLLGWIRSKEDIQKEFTDEMSKGAEKYFKSNYTCIGENTIKLLTTREE